MTAEFFKLRLDRNTKKEAFDERPLESPTCLKKSERYLRKGIGEERRKVKASFDFIISYFLVAGRDLFSSSLTEPCDVLEGENYKGGRRTVLNVNGCEEGR